MISELLINVLRVSILVSFLMFVMLFIRRLTNVKAGAWWRSVIWLILMCRLCIPIIPSSSLSYVSLFQGEVVTVESIDHTLNQDDNEMVNVINSNTKLTKIPIERTITTETNWISILSIVYIIGVMVSVGMLIYNGYRLSKNTKSLKPCKRPWVQTIFNSTKDKFHVDKSIELLVDDFTHTPYLSGLIKSKIILPNHFMDTMTTIQLELMFIHELTHYKRKDIFKIWLLEVVMCIHFFNPVVRYMRKIIRQDFELACDEQVLSKLESNQFSLYAEILTLSALNNTFNKHEILTAHMAGRHGEKLKERLQMIGHYNRKITGLLGAALIISMMLLLISCTTDADENKTETGANTISTQDDILGRSENNDSIITLKSPTSITSVLAEQIINEKDSIKFLDDLETFGITPYSVLYYLDKEVLMAEEFSEVVERLLIYPIMDTQQALYVTSQYGEVNQLMIDEYEGQAKSKKDSPYYLVTNLAARPSKPLVEHDLEKFLNQPLSTFLDAFEVEGEGAIISNGETIIHFHVFEGEYQRGCYVFEKNGVISSILVNDDTVITLEHIEELFKLEDGIVDIVTHESFEDYEGIASEIMKGYYNIDSHVDINKSMVTDMGTYDWVQLENGIDFKIDKDSLDVFYIINYIEGDQLDNLLTKEACFERLKHYISNSEILRSKDFKLVTSKYEVFFNSSDVEYYVFEMTAKETVYFFKIETRTGNVVEITKDIE